MTKLSIITINYNNKEGLQKTISSVLSQTYKDFEFIIIDGGSNDGSKALIEEVQDKLSFWVSEKDTGIYNAQNKGMQNAKGDYCLFLNSGDFLCNSKVLEEAISFGLDKEIVYGNMKINWGNASITDGIMPDTIDLKHMLKDTLWHPVSFIKRSLFEQYGSYNEQYKMVADYDFFFRVIIVNTCSRKHIPVFIAEYNTDGVSSDPSKKTLEKQERKQVISSYLSAEELKEAMFYLKEHANPIKRIIYFIKNCFKA